MVAAVVWIVVGIALAVAEVFTTTFVLLMFALGAIGAAVTAAVGGGPAWQLLVFGVCSALSLAALRPALTRHRTAIGGSIPTGAAAVEGQPGVVLQTVDGERGLIKIGGEVWSARSYDETQVIAPGEHVQVMRIDGATALVWRN